MFVTLAIRLLVCAGAFASTVVRRHRSSFFQLSMWSSFHTRTWLWGKRIILHLIATPKPQYFPDLYCLYQSNQQGKYHVYHKMYHVDFVGFISSLIKAPFIFGIAENFHKRIEHYVIIQLALFYNITTSFKLAHDAVAFGIT